jgi:hypothetical protein
MGEALEQAIKNNDVNKRNAVLFTIMQNPNAKVFISAEDFPGVEKE